METLTLTKKSFSHLTSMTMKSGLLTTTQTHMGTRKPHFQHSLEKMKTSSWKLVEFTCYFLEMEPISMKSRLTKKERAHL